MKKWLKALIALGFVLALGGWGVMEGMKRAWIRYNEYDIRSEGSLQVGDLAPDIELETTDGSQPRRISELYADKPLVLTFGSYT